MSDRPIIFSSPMVRALLDGRKTQTRRALNPQPETLPNGFAGSRLPYAFGDRLWVREAFVIGFDIDDEMGRPVGDRKVWFRATEKRLTWHDPDTERTLDNPPWRSPIHMPRWASRLTLTVFDVRVQRLQEISEADAVAEGAMAEYGEGAAISHRRAFNLIWNSLHGPDAWAANPWVAALTFTVQRGNIDKIGRAS